MRRVGVILICLAIMTVLSGCGQTPAAEAAPEAVPSPTMQHTAEELLHEEIEEVSAGNLNEDTEEAPFGDSLENTEETEEEMMSLNLQINEKEVSVEWEDNESVRALRELCADSALTVQMSMYGGFEQVGFLGTRLPRDDEQTTTGSGDIVLYSGDQIVIFYGSNTWAYTPLGHITDLSQDELRSLLGNGNVTVTLNNF